jgi:hypothetical protein
MHGTIDEFRRHFESLSDEGLAQVNRDELVDTARQCYDAEVGRRGIPPTRSGEEAPPANAPEDQDLVEVGNFLWAGQAQLAEGLLRSESIPCFLQNENTLRMDWLWTNGAGGLRLMVPSSAAERAREILAAPVSEAELEKEAEAALPGGPPPC